ILQFTSLFVLSWAIGYLSIVTPMGLGVREIATSEELVLIGKIGFGTASAISILSRAFLIIAELLFLIISYGIQKLDGVERMYKKLSTQVWILSASIISYITYFTYVTCMKHENFFTGRFD